MVRDYKRTTNRGSWSEESMREAIKAVLDSKMGYYRAAKQFDVPQTTLERKVKAARAVLKETSDGNLPLPIKVPLGPKLPVFSAFEEGELCAYILEMEERSCGLTVKDVKELVYKLAIKNNKPNPFNAEKEEAGTEWMNGFLKRHPELSIRKPENTFTVRASGSNKVAVEKFFNFLGNVYDEHQLTSDRVYNCDEIGISVVPKTKSKIIAKRGRKQVGAIVSERGQTVTVEICFSASGNYMPPMLIFPRRMTPDLMVNSQAGAWATCSDSGWITSELFLQWFKRFVIFSGASKERPVLLLLDGQSTHTRNIDLINEARTHGVIILCFPPHTNRLQVAIAFMRPLSVYYEQAVTAWLRSNPGLDVTISQVAEVFGNAFVQAAAMSTAVNGFRESGIWPYNPNVFSVSDFAPLTTEIHLNDSRTSTNQEVLLLQDISYVTTTQTIDTVVAQTADNAATLNRHVDDSLPGCSYWSPGLGQEPPSTPYQTKDQPETLQMEQNQQELEVREISEDAEQKKIEEMETKKRKEELKKQKKTTTKAQNKKSKKNSRTVKTAKRRRVSSSGDENEDEEDTPYKLTNPDVSVSTSNQQVLSEGVNKTSTSTGIYENLAENEQIVIKKENEELFESLPICVDIKIETNEETDEVTSQPVLEQSSSRQNILEGTRETEEKKKGAKKKSSRKVTCSAKVYENALATGVNVIIARVYQFLKKEYDYLTKTYGGLLDLTPFSKYMERTAEATGFNISVVEKALTSLKKSVVNSKGQEENSDTDSCDEKFDTIEDRQTDDTETSPTVSQTRDLRDQSDIKDHYDSSRIEIKTEADPLMMETEHVESTDTSRLLTTNKRVAESEAVPLKRETEDNDSTEPVLNTTTNYLKRRKSNSDIDPLKIEIDTFDSRNNSSDDSVPVDKDSDNSDEEDS